MARDDTDFTEWAPGDPAPPKYDKAARRAARSTRPRRSRLPFLYDVAERGRPQLVLTSLVHIVLVVVVGLGAVRLLSGSWFPPGAALVVLAVSLGLQSLNSYLNARAGRT